MRFALSVAALATLPFVASFVVNDELLSFCKSPLVAHQSYIGDVKMSAIQCANFLPGVLNKRQEAAPADVCGAECTTHCFSPSGTGPNPHDCNVIADALRYDSQDIGQQFNITNSTHLFTLQYHSCQTMFVNQASADLTYCRSDWAALVDYLAFNCQAQQNAHGGLCVADNSQWFVQVWPYVNATATSTASTATATATSSASSSSVPPLSSLSSAITSVTATSTASSASASVVTTSAVTTETSASTATETSTSTSTSTTSASTSTATEVSTTTSASVTTTTAAETATATTTA